MIGVILLRRSRPLKAEFLEVCSFEPSIVIVVGAPKSDMNFLRASSMSTDFFDGVGYAATNICLFPNTWHILSPCKP